MSGTTECIFAIGNEDHIISLARRIAGNVKQPNTTKADLIKFYTQADSKDIVNSGLILGDHKHAEINFVPIVESEYFYAVVELFRRFFFKCNINK